MPRNMEAVGFIFIGKYQLFLKVEIKRQKEAKKCILFIAIFSIKVLIKKNNNYSDM